MARLFAELGESFTGLIATGAPSCTQRLHLLESLQMQRPLALSHHCSVYNDSCMR